MSLVFERSFCTLLLCQAIFSQLLLTICHCVLELSCTAIAMQVWQVLTDYERLPEVVPNLAVCERVQTPTGMSKRVTRLRQVTSPQQITAIASAPGQSPRRAMQGVQF